MSEGRRAEPQNIGVWLNRQRKKRWGLPVLSVSSSAALPYFTGGLYLEYDFHHSQDFPFNRCTLMHLYASRHHGWDYTQWPCMLLSETFMCHLMHRNSPWTEKIISWVPFMKRHYIVLRDILTNKYNYLSIQSPSLAQQWSAPLIIYLRITAHTSSNKQFIH